MTTPTPSLVETTILQLQRDLATAQEARQRAEALAESNARDAERYRFLRNTYPDYRGLVAVVDLSTDASAWLSHEYLDRAIDAAIAEGK